MNKQRRIRICLTGVLLAVSTTTALAGITYEYDKLNRLTKVIYANGTAITFEYDEVGNRLRKLPIGPVYNATQDMHHMTIQDALDSAIAGDDIWVAEGVHTPTARTDPNDPRTATFQLVDGVSLYGGFPVGTWEWAARDPKAYQTTLTGDLDGNDGPAFANYDDNSYTVVMGAENAILSGFTIRAGNSYDRGNWEAGGIVSYAPSFRVIDCVLSDNLGWNGGAMVSSGTVRDCLFTNNRAGQDGGGICGPSLTLINCNFVGNDAFLSGGAIYVWGSAIDVIQCTFSGNTAGNYGGGAIKVWRGDANITNCTFAGNGTEMGCALEFGSWSGPRTVAVRNSILWNGGSEIRVADGSLVTVMYSNVQGGWPGIGNIAADPSFVDGDGGDDVRGTEDDDLHLSSDSPCVDSGANLSVPADVEDIDDDGDTAEHLPLDLDKNLRFVDVPATPDCPQPNADCGTRPIVDMGAYEYQMGPVQLRLHADSGCYDWVGPKSDVTVTVDLTKATHLVQGGDFFLRYDNSSLDFISAKPGNRPFTVQLYEAVDEGAGAIAYAVGVPTGDPGTATDTTMAAITFAALGEVCESGDLVWFDRTHEPPTKLGGEEGQQINPILVDLRTITIDGEAPAVACPSDVTVQCLTDAPAPAPDSVSVWDNCSFAEATYEGDVSDELTCPETITRSYCATDGCGNVSCCQQLIVVNDTIPPTIGTCPDDRDLPPDAGSCEAVVKYRMPDATDNCDAAPRVVCDPPSESTVSKGATHVTCVATDNCANSGAASACAFDVRVEDYNALSVTVESSPTVHTPVTRCITFELWECPDTLPSAVVQTDLDFVAVGGGVGRASDTISIPCGHYDCITARDRLHTLRRTDEGFGASPDGTHYVADFTGNVKVGGDWLVGGNLDDTRWIDILDYTVFLSQWNTPVFKDTMCDTPSPHADVSADGIVSTSDFTFIQAHYFEGHEANCCGMPSYERGNVATLELPGQDRRAVGRVRPESLERNESDWLNDQGAAIAAASAEINLVWRPASQAVRVGDAVSLGLYAVVQDPAKNVSTSAMDVILQWNAASLELSGVVNNGLYEWLFSGFPDDSQLDGLNDTWADGDALYSAFAQFGDPAWTTPDGLLVTNFQFIARAPTPEATLAIPEEVGDYTQTAVFGGPGLDVTGTLGTATVTVSSALGDCDADGNIDLYDYVDFQACASGSGSSAGDDCGCADFDGDDDVDLTDFARLQDTFTGPK